MTSTTSHFDPFAATQLAVEGKIGEGQITMVFRQLKPQPDRPEVFKIGRSFLADDPAPVLGRTQRANGG